MIEILQYEFMRNAIAAGVLASVAAGIIGTYVVSKRMVFISGGISHAAFGGIGIGYFLGVNPILAAAVFGVVFALLIGKITRRTNERTDTAIGIMWSLGMAIGIVFVYMTPGYAPNLMSYLFGSILTVTLDDLFLMAALDLVIVLGVILLYNDFFAVSFDEEFATVRGVPVERVNMILLALIALTVVILIKIVGIILVIAMLSIPAAISGRFSSSLKGMMAVSTVVSSVFMGLGLLVSYAYDLPSGATIILVAAFGYLVFGAFFGK
ncbi:MAG: metal ABC transporter permease [archaeon]